MARRPRGVRKRADSRWEARRSIGYRESAVRLSGYGNTMGEAIEDLERKVAAHERRMDLDAAADWTLAEYLAWWTSEELPARQADGDLASTSVRAYSSIVRLHISGAEVARRTPLANLSAAHVRRLLADAAAAGATVATRERIHAMLVIALSCAERYELVEGNPASRVPKPRPPRAPRGAETTVDHARALLDAATGRRFEGLWRLLLSVPLRPGEPIGADVADFDLEGGVYVVRWNLQRGQWPDGARDSRGRRRCRWERHDTKTHRAREVPLDDAVAAAIAAQLERRDMARAWAGPAWQEPAVWSSAGEPVATDLLFRGAQGQPVWHPEISAELTDMCAAAGVPRLTPHKLRHAAITLLLDSGVHPAVVQQLAGHSAAAMTDLYTGALDGAMREAVQTLARRLR